MRIFFIIIFLLIGNVFADDGIPIRLEKVKINLNDRAALLRGATFYMQNCMVCHTMKYLAHDPLAKQAGITLDKMPLNQKEWSLSIVPPDLSLVARRRTPNWLYTYFLSFYKDPTRLAGYNNLLFKEVNMPNIFAPFQGEQELTEHGKQLIAGVHFYKPHYYNVLELTKSGSVSAEQLDETLTDLVNFFVYASDPESVYRIYIGIGVILFLIIFLVLAILLKKTYWQDIKSNKQK